MELRMKSFNLLMSAAVRGCQNFTFFNLRAAENLLYYTSHFPICCKTNVRVLFKKLGEALCVKGVDNMLC